MVTLAQFTAWRVASVRSEVQRHITAIVKRKRLVTAARMDAVTHSFFGMLQKNIKRTWLKLIRYNVFPIGTSTLHLLWALMFLKLYLSYNVALASVDVTTYTKYYKLIIGALCELHIHVVSTAVCDVFYMYYYYAY